MLLLVLVKVGTVLSEHRSEPFNLRTKRLATSQNVVDSQGNLMRFKYTITRIIILIMAILGTSLIHFFISLKISILSQMVAQSCFRAKFPLDPETRNTLFDAVTIVRKHVSVQSLVSFRARLMKPPRFVQKGD